MTGNGDSLQRKCVIIRSTKEYSDKDLPSFRHSLVFIIPKRSEEVYRLIYTKVLSIWPSTYSVCISLECCERGLAVGLGESLLLAVINLPVPTSTKTKPLYHPRFAIYQPPIHTDKQPPPEMASASSTSGDAIDRNVTTDLATHDQVTNPPPKKLDSFTLFPSLSAELRVMIWRLAAHHPGALEIYLPPQHRRSKMRFRHCALVPVMLHISHEARTEGFEYYNVASGYWHGGLGEVWGTRRARKVVRSLIPDGS